MEAHPAGAIKEPDTTFSHPVACGTLTERGSALDGSAYYEGKGSGEAAWQPLDGGGDDSNVDGYYVYDGDSNGDEDESAPADARSPPLLSPQEARHGQCPRPPHGQWQSR